eukprot:GEMP01059317.1.p1 GENE.GEMP01059317.1~~GEMP01059317.1.p1  ORF type:complete len:117 (+),score=1.15 GEMP01059317.1:573-923(+)
MLNKNGRRFCIRILVHKNSVREGNGVEFCFFCPPLPLFVVNTKIRVLFLCHRFWKRYIRTAFSQQNKRGGFWCDMCYRAVFFLCCPFLGTSVCVFAESNKKEEDSMLLYFLVLLFK